YKQAIEISKLKKVPEYNHLLNKASVKDLQGLNQHIEDSMINSGFLDKDKPGHVMDKLRRLFKRSELESQEVNILRGFLTSLENQDK
ncbi:RNA methyltransferase, partial [Francisella tularensis subsp. holarctica]|nr:RNA methyltransferase [Francisella tularensis subsp. holarctica]